MGQPIPDPVFQQVEDILLVIIEGVGTDAAALDQGGDSDFIKRHFFEHFFEGVQYDFFSVVRHIIPR